MQETAVNQALNPIPTHERVFAWHDHAALWFSLGVGLLVMQVGAYLVPAVGIREAIFATLAGSVIGAGLLAWVSKIAADSGLSSAGLMYRSLGSGFARLPVLLNIVQLIGWTSFELLIMREGSLAIAAQTLGISAESPIASLLAALVWGLLLAGLLAGSMQTLVRRFVSRFGLPLVVISLIWLTFQFASRLAGNGWETFWNRPGDGSLGLFGALDLVIAMPISWLPLVADYARHGRSGRSALGGVWLGYAVANIWCYALGVMIASSGAAEGSVVTALLLAQGGLIALGLILVDELDNAYGDLYSASVSAHSLLPRLSIRHFAWLLLLVGTLCALLLPMHSLEPFLLLLSSIFVPLYGVILGRQAFGAVARPASSRLIEPVPAALWLLGIAFYHGLPQFTAGFGAALPTLAVTFTLSLLTRLKNKGLK